MISDYKVIAAIHDDHKIYLVENMKTSKFFTMKKLDVYYSPIYHILSQANILGVPKIIEYREENHQLTVIEEFIPGETLADKIQSGTLTSKQILSYIYHLCVILEKLHRFQPPIIHRDIKPSNVIITPYDKPVLLDFNAAKYYTKKGEQDTTLLGTQGYAAPEQFGFGSSTPQTDIYALGILFRECVKSLPFADHAYDAIISKCIELNPKDRYQNVSELKNELAPYINPYEFFQPKNYSILPPGFRTMNPLKMILATVGYGFLAYFSFTYDIDGTTGFSLLLARIVTMACFVTMIFAGFNYRNMQKFFPICKSPRRILRVFGIIIYELIIFFLYLLVLIIITEVLP